MTHPEIEELAYTLKPKDCVTLSLKMEGRQIMLPYHNFVQATYTDNKIVLKYSSGFAEISGLNLDELWFYLQSQIVSSIRPLDSRNDKGVSVKSITWT